MKPAPFSYFAPDSLEEALQLMADHGFDAKLLAGGQSLIPVMNFRLAQPGVIVDLNRVTELQAISSGTHGGLQLGAMTRHSQVEYSDLVAGRSPLLHETMPYIAHPQIRNRGTIGGSLAHADPAAELPVIMVALDAQFKLKRQGQERWVPAVDFYEALFTTALEPEEILVEIDIPPFPAGTGYSFLEIARRHGDYAQAGVAAWLTLDEAGVCQQARLVYLNLGEIPQVANDAVQLLVGEKPTPDLLAEVAQTAAKNEIDPVGDIHATADYKRHLAFVLGKRALQQAVKRV